MDEQWMTPVPTSIPATDETPAVPQNASQHLVERRLEELAVLFGSRLGMERREFLRTSCGMAAAFMAMNSVYGSLFRVDPAEAADPHMSLYRSAKLKNQPIFDVQTHFVSDTYDSRLILGIRDRAKKWNPQLKGNQTLDKIRFGNYVNEMFLASDTKLALLSSAPGDSPEKWFIHNDEMAAAREQLNSFAGSKRLFTHAVFTPARPGAMEAFDRGVELKPDSWKGYTVGEPFGTSKWPWRLDDEKLAYPFYEKMVKAGITIVCIHKGLLPPIYKAVMRGTWKYGMVDDVGKAAKDWPQLNFVIYHAGIRNGGAPAKDAVKDFEGRGYIPWVSDLAEVPVKFGVKNVYAELGSVFAATAISNPRYCAGILGTLIKGMGADHVVWGTDSVWYGSPQWQIEALRRLEIPEDLQKKFRFAPLGAADGDVKSAIFYGNSAAMYRLPASAALPSDWLARLREEGREVAV